MTEALVDLRDEYLKEALDYIDDSNTEDQIDFYKESHDDDPIDAKEQNGKSIKKLFQLANAAATNLRYGDGSSNSAIQENFDPMGDKDGVLTKHETEMLETYVVTKDVAELFDGIYYVRSSTGVYQPDSKYNNRWYIKCLKNNENCY